MLKWLKKKESIVLGGEIVTSKAIPEITNICSVYKGEKKWLFFTISTGDNRMGFEFKLKREAVEAREKLIIFYEKWR